MTADDLVDAADESLFRKFLCSQQHVLDELLPRTSQPQETSRDRTLPERKGHLSANHVVVRLLYKET